MKNYYIRYDIGDGIPSYDFCLRAKDLDKAVKLAQAILENDYPEEWRENRDFSCRETSAEQLLKDLTIN